MGCPEFGGLAVFGSPFRRWPPILRSAQRFGLIDRIILKAELNDYNLKNYTQAWHTPDWKADLYVFYKIGDKIRLDADIFMFGETNALLPGNEEGAIDGIMDMNAGITYNYSKNISLFVNLNNLSDTVYKRWYNYPGYGFNVIGGLALSL